MGQPMAITRTDLSAAGLRAHAAQSRDGAVVRRLLALALLLEGHSRIAAATMSGMTRQTLGDWVHRYNAAGVAGLGSRRSPGRPPLLSEARGAELKALVLAGPDPERHAVVRWRCLDLREEITLRWSVRVCEQTVGRWLRQLGLSRVQPRPCHPEKDPDAAMAFKTYGPPRLQVPSVPGLNSLRQRIRPMGIALAKMEIRTVRSS